MDSFSMRNWEIFDVLDDDELEEVKNFYVFGENDKMGAFYITRTDVVYGIGYNDNWNLLGFSQRGMSQVAEARDRTEVPLLSHKGITNISVGCSIGAAVTSNRRLYLWGRSYKRDNCFEYPHEVKIQGHAFVRVACGSEFVAAMTVSNRVYMWGLINPSANRCQQYRISEDLDVMTFSCGLQHLAMVTTGGYVFTCGFGGNGQLGRDWDEEEERFLTPHEVELDDACAQVACGCHSTIFLLGNGSVFACGLNTDSSGYLGVKSDGFVDFPERVALNEQVEEIAANHAADSAMGSMYSAISVSKKVFCWGEVRWPKLCRGATVLMQAFSHSEMPASCPIGPRIAHRVTPQARPPATPSQGQSAAPVLSPTFLSRVNPVPDDSIASIITDIVELQGNVKDLYNTLYPLLEQERATAPNPAQSTQGASSSQPPQQQAPRSNKRKNVRRNPTRPNTAPRFQARPTVPQRNTSAPVRQNNASNNYYSRPVSFNYYSDSSSDSDY